MFILQIDSVPQPQNSPNQALYFWLSFVWCIFGETIKGVAVTSRPIDLIDFFHACHMWHRASIISIVSWCENWANEKNNDEIWITQCSSNKLNNPYTESKFVSSIHATFTYNIPTTCHFVWMSIYLPVKLVVMCDLPNGFISKFIWEKKNCSFHFFSILSSSSAYRFIRHFIATDDKMQERVFIVSRSS